MDIEILCKNKNDSFTPAILRLFKDSFACIDATSGKPLTPDMFWSYDWIGMPLPMMIFPYLGVLTYITKCMLQIVLSCERATNIWIFDFSALVTASAA
jgi:hypothetical protein